MVVDASFILAVWFDEEGSAKARSVLDHYRHDVLTAPALVATEFANVVVMKERAGRIMPQEVDAALGIFSLLNIKTCPDNDLVRGDAVRLARTYRLTVYDASYLALAIREHAPLATLDKELRNAAQKAGVTVLPESL